MASYEKRTWWSNHKLTERLQNPAFLDAAVTTAVVIAAADGSMSEQEQDALLDRLEILGGVDRDKIDELVTDVTRDLEGAGFEPRIAKLDELLADEAEGEAALMLGLAIALADDDVSADEREVLNQIVGALGLTVDLDKLIAEVRG